VTALLALASAVFIGGADFLGGLTSRTANGIRVAALVAVVGMPLAVVVAVVYGAERVTATDVGWSVSSGLAVAVGISCFYTAMGRGLISVVAPLAAVVGAVSPVVYDLVRGERPGMVVLIGLAIALVAIAVVSMAPSDQHPGAVGVDAKVIGLSIASGLFFSVFYISLSRVSPSAGLWPVPISRGAGSVLLVVLALCLTSRPEAGERHLLPTVLAISTLEVIAEVPLIVALQRGPVAVASVVASLYPVMTVILAGVVLRERLSRLQYVGVSCALVAVVLVSTG
jgi:drug/metabolite transporter (DMT)-like permease